MRGRRHQPRAERFALSVPARVRPVGHSIWRDADVVNVSRTGALLAVTAVFPPANSIDLVFGISDGGARPTDVRCVAHVVREDRDGAGRPLLGVTIDDYALDGASGMQLPATWGFRR